MTMEDDTKPFSETDDLELELELVPDGEAALDPASSGSEASASPPSGASPPSESTSITPKTANADANDNATKKRSPSSVGSASTSNAPAKATKRRAARACVSCRARKVRCDVVEGAPCGNCRWDNVECVVQESRRRRKNLHHLTANAVRHVPPAEAPQPLRTGDLSAAARPTSIASSDLRRPSVGSVSLNGGDVSANGPLLGGGLEGHVPHMIYQRSGYQQDPVSAERSSPRAWSNLLNQVALYGDLRTAQFLSTLEEPDLHSQLPAFIRPLPAKIAAEDVRFLRAKGALTLPSIPLQNALIQSYVEFVHPFMPLLDLRDFLNTVDSRDGLYGQVSLFLYQAVMFAGTAYVDLKYLREAGYPTRKAARKAFFQKTRLLYDFDYESDRLVLVQALLLKTFWYESPDDQKDTWHWMGVAISLAHTIGLHRNPSSSAIPPRKQRLRKRIWWSCFMRDRLIALGMRRPTRIKDEDFDVPMLEVSDFELEELPLENTILGAGCAIVRNLGIQHELAVMCIAKANLCIHISQMLKAQYSVLSRERMPDQTTNSTMMLLPNKFENTATVDSVDKELLSWADTLEPCCKYQPISHFDVQNGRSTIAVHRAILHMVYHTTVSALHRPQFLPSSPVNGPTTSRDVQEMSRVRVRDAALRITQLATDLHQYHLERYLPTTGVTVVLPAMIIHLLEMKSQFPDAQERAFRGFKQCMKVMQKLTEMYAAADYAVGFLEAALKKAAIDLNNRGNMVGFADPNMKYQRAAGNFSEHTPPPENIPYMTASEEMMYHSSQRQNSTFVAPLTTTAAAVELFATSPPQSDGGLDSPQGDLTPTASVSSESAPLESEFAQGQVPWMSGGPMEMDVDQWLQFPPEGVSNSDDTFMAGILAEEPSMTAEEALAWAFSTGPGVEALAMPGPTNVAIEAMH